MEHNSRMNDLQQALARMVLEEARERAADESVPEQPVHVHVIHDSENCLMGMRVDVAALMRMVCTAVIKEAYSGATERDVSAMVAASYLHWTVVVPAGDRRSVMPTNVCDAMIALGARVVRAGSKRDGVDVAVRKELRHLKYMYERMTPDAQHATVVVLVSGDADMASAVVDLQRVSRGQRAPHVILLSGPNIGRALRSLAPSLPLWTHMVAACAAPDLTAPAAAPARASAALPPGCASTDSDVSSSDSSRSPSRSPSPPPRVGSTRRAAAPQSRATSVASGPPALPQLTARIAGVGPCDRDDNDGANASDANDGDAAHSGDGGAVGEALCCEQWRVVAARAAASEYKTTVRLSVAAAVLETAEVRARLSELRVSVQIAPRQKLRVTLGAVPPGQRCVVERTVEERLETAGFAVYRVAAVAGSASTFEVTLDKRMYAHADAMENALMRAVASGLFPKCSTAPVAAQVHYSGSARKMARGSMQRHVMERVVPYLKSLESFVASAVVRNVARADVSAAVAGKRVKVWVREHTGGSLLVAVRGQYDECTKTMRELEDK